MAWERRKRGGFYYTRSKRVGGRVVREYFGCGEGAQLIAALDEADREDRAAAEADREQDRAGLLAVQDALASLGASLDTLTISTLEASGYHRHKGQGRRRRSP